MELEFVEGLLVEKDIVPNVVQVNGEGYLRIWMVVEGVIQ